VNDQTSIYFAATCYACELLGDAAAKHFVRLYELSKYNTLEELKSIIDSWLPRESRPKPQASGDWAPGAAWGDAVRVEPLGGIFWKLKCACGKVFKLSTNDTVPENRRKCSTCILADELSEGKREIVAKLDATTLTVLQWHNRCDRLVWSRVHRACDKRGKTDPEFRREFHALVWTKIVAVADQYTPERGKVSGFIGTVATNAIADYFKVNDNREKLTQGPMVPLPEGDKNRIAAAPATRTEEILPAKKTGLPPDVEVVDTGREAWDKKTGRAWAN
jgi:hypothetical protein